MAKTLILTEKPSVARDFARALKINGNRDGYIENNQFIITWAVGHLVELKKPEDYNIRWKTWLMESLPIMPQKFEYIPIENTQKQFHIIQHLLKKDIQKIVIATDAGREGEVIARTILHLCNQFTDNSTYRFWTSQALTDSVIREVLDQCKPAKEYDRLWKAGQSRQIADWLVGMNGSRAATLKMNDLFSVGRVQTAVLALLVDRRRERENFKPEPYWVLKALFSNDKGTWWGTWFHKRETRLSTESIALEKEKKIQGQDGEVQSVKKQKKSESPPLLYSLTDLQRDANSKFGFSAQKTLQLAQDLYEKFKCLSYPRTDSKVLGSKNVDLVKKTINNLSGHYADMFAGIQEKRVSKSYKRVFNDSKLTDHHALMPLSPLPSNASAEHQKIYMMVLKRFAQAFHADCRFEQTEIITIVCDETFRSKGKIILAPGWRALESTDTTKKSKVSKDSDDDEDQEHLPPLEKKDPAHVDETNCLKKQTKPPPEYTEALLLRDMTNPGRYVSEEELKKIYRGDVGLGTQSTRAQTIEILISRKYIARKKRQVIATDKGCLLIETLRQFPLTQKLTSPEETARWEMQLEDIAQGKGSDQEFLDAIKNFVIQSVEEFKTHSITMERNKLGACPQCGGEIIKGRIDYGCANWRETDGGCKVVIRSNVNGRAITPHMIKTLLTEKEIGPYRFPGNDPECGMILLQQTNDHQWELVVKKTSKKKTKQPKNVIAECPACGGEVIDTPKAYGCSNWKDIDGGCKFKIWKTIAKRDITPNEARQLIETGTTDLLNGFMSKKGNSFDARLVLDSKDGNTPDAVFKFS